MGKVISINNNSVIAKREKAKLYSENIESLNDLSLIFQAVENGLITDMDIVFKYNNKYFCYNNDKTISKEQFIYNLLLKLKETEGKVIIK